MNTPQKITPCLWFVHEALPAAEFYSSLLPDSRIDHVHRARSDWPAGKEGDVLLVTFTLAGQRYQALNGGAHESFTNAVSFSIDCEDQAEVDGLWEKLTANGGKPVACGWLNDKYGLAWQIVPRRLPELLSDPDPAVGRRAMEAMMSMVKIDVAALEAAVRG